MSGRPLFQKTPSLCLDPSHIHIKRYNQSETCPSHHITHARKAVLRPTRTVDILGAAIVPPEVSLSNAAGTVVRPVAVIPFNESTTSIAGPTLKKSTKKKVGALPYCAVQSEAADPSVPTPLPGEFVTGE